MQYLFEKSDENLESNGLGFFKGIVKKFTNTKEHHTIPNIGKNVLSRSLLKWPGTIFDINIECSRVSRVGVIGANGAGKSTAIKILIGELKTSQGTVTHGVV